MEKRTREHLLEGVWLTGKKDARIEISRTGDTYSGKIVWLEITHETDGSIRKDHRNPDYKLRDNEVMGLVILKDFKYAGKGSWEGGSLYDPDTGNTYQGNMKIEDNEDVLILRGYVGIPLFGRSDNWTRYKG